MSAILNSFEQIQSDVYNQKSKSHKKGQDKDDNGDDEEEKYDDNNDTSDATNNFSNENSYNQTYLNDKRENEIQHQTQIILI
jgi:hypothetical protein